MLCRQQAEFLRSLTKQTRLHALGARAGLQLPPQVQFVCVVGTGTGVGDGLVSKRSQWTEELQHQGVPAVRVRRDALARTAREKRRGIDRLAPVREPQPRLGPGPRRRGAARNPARRSVNRSANRGSCPSGTARTPEETPDERHRTRLRSEQIAFARGYTRRLIDKLDPADWFRITPAGVSHVAWQVGHLANAEYRLVLLRLRGEQPGDKELFSGGVPALFGINSKPEPDPRGITRPPP